MKKEELADKKCICTKPAQFWSTRLTHGFCSDQCYEMAQRGTNPESAHIITTRKQGAYFQQGDIKFPVDSKSLDKTLGAGPFKNDGSCLDKLMDSQIAALAQANGLPIQPFVRELVLSPLRGVVQLVWYRDLEKHSSDHLTSNQFKRIEDYKRALVNYRPGDASEGDKKARKASSKSMILSHSYRVSKNAGTPARGRSAAVYDVIKSFKDGATVAQIVEAANGKVKTKQDIERIVQRFIKELLQDKLIEEAK